MAEEGEASRVDARHDGSGEVGGYGGGGGVAGWEAASGGASGGGGAAEDDATLRASTYTAVVASLSGLMSADDRRHEAILEALLASRHAESRATGDLLGVALQRARARKSGSVTLPTTAAAALAASPAVAAAAGGTPTPPAGDALSTPEFQRCVCFPCCVHHVFLAYPPTQTPTHLRTHLLQQPAPAGACTHPAAAYAGVRVAGGRARRGGAAGAARGV